MLPARINIFSPRPESNRLDRAKFTPKIINLSSKPLTERHINLLRGPKFTAFTEFTRKLRLIEFLHSENLDNSQETRERVSGPLVKNKSNFYPPRNRKELLDTTNNFINQ